MILSSPIPNPQLRRPIAPTPTDIYISQYFDTVWIADRDMVVNGIQITKGQNVYKSLFGWDSHSGIDIVCPIGTPIYAPCNGYIIESVNKSSGLGLRVALLAERKGRDEVHVFGHLSESKFGDIPWSYHDRSRRVMRGDLIALSGNSGFSTGPHTHWDKFEYINGIKQHANNGHGGRLDPWPDVRRYFMEILQIAGEQTLVIKNLDGKYIVIATTPEFYPILASKFGLEGKNFDIVPKAEVEGKIIGELKAGFSITA